MFLSHLFLLEVICQFHVYRCWTNCINEATKRLMRLEQDSKFSISARRENTIGTRLGFWAEHAVKFLISNCPKWMCAFIRISSSYLEIKVRLTEQFGTPVKLWRNVLPINNHSLHSSVWQGAIQQTEFPIVPSTEGFLERIRSEEMDIWRFYRNSESEPNNLSRI